MKTVSDQIILSASDLVGHLNCAHLTDLDLQVVAGKLAKPKRWDPLLEILRERGARHEHAFIAHLQAQGLRSAEIEGVEITSEAVAKTRAAMKDGIPVIVQAALAHERWVGRADILRRVDTPSALGDWSYEVIDTKLARETKAGSVLQLCLYAHLLEHAQGQAPEHVFVVAPWSDYEPQVFRYADYAAYFRRVKAAAEGASEDTSTGEHYPEPKEHCEICRWQSRCEARRRADDHLCLVAGITKNQTAELQENGLLTASALAAMPLPMPWKPKKGSRQSFERAREQARIQIASREAGEVKYELLDVVPETGLCLLPEPSEGDIFFDIESDAHVGEHGLEYLFGYVYRDESGDWTYTADWALDRENEKAIFERFVDFVNERRKEYPDLHIYHYAPYEPGALKRLMGRYATREAEIDDFLRQHLLVDLYAVVRHALRAGVESYSIKKLEPVYAFKRDTSLPDANIALARLQAGLELGDIEAIDEEVCATVQSYNYEDCTSTIALRDWLEEKRSELVGRGTEVRRPEAQQPSPSEELSKRQQKVQRLIERLTDGVPADMEERSAEQQAKWILAHILDWHRREEKATWWEYFRLSDLTPDELLDERAALAHLTFVEDVTPPRNRVPTHRYRFAPQDTDLRGGEKLKAVGGDHFGSVISISAEGKTVDIKKTGQTANTHPDGVFAHKVFDTKEQAAALVRLAEFVAENGIDGDGEFFSARSLLMLSRPELGGGPIKKNGETTLQAALRVSSILERGVLPIQGPPGTGKSYTGARMICELVKRGKKVGITANSHKVIRNLLDKVIEAAPEMGVDVTCVQKPDEREPNQDHLNFVMSNDGVYSALNSGSAQVAGATHFLWAREDAFETVDVLVIDEAAQMSLANVLAVAQSAKALILLGDPQQLDQPTQGTHPDGTGGSALEHVLASAQTIADEQGLFLADTWRLHPEICRFNSELFYEDKLKSVAGCERQHVRDAGPLSGTGLKFLPIKHAGNQSASIEEADAIHSLVEGVLKRSPTWTDRDGKVHPLTLDDILIIAPYNAQVFEIQQRLPNAKVGTVDKFQGQEAPIAIYSMATSGHADAPRGMEFLYSPNRFNVAVSRAKCVALLVASPAVFEADCRTPRQMQLANAFCRYLERAEEIKAF